MTETSTQIVSDDTTKELEGRLDQLPALSIEDVTERTIQRTMAATTADDVLADPQAKGLEAFTGQVITINKVLGALPSDFQTGLTRYLVLEIARSDTGELDVVTTGSLFVVSRVFKLMELNALPAKVRVLELESKNKKGQSSLWIVKASGDF